MFLQKLIKLNYYWFITVIHILVLKKKFIQPCPVQTFLLLSFTLYQLRVKKKKKPLQPLIDRAPWDRTQVLEHLLPHIRHTQFTITDSVLWMLRAEEQLQGSVLWVIQVLIVKVQVTAVNPMVPMSAELPDKAYPRLSLDCAIGIKCWLTRQKRQGPSKTSHL